MSTNFVDLVRSSYAAVRRGDIDSVLAHTDPGIEIVGPPGLPGAKTYTGREGLLEALHDMSNACGEPERLIDAGKERVIAVIPASGRVDLYTGRDGKCVRWEMFTSLDDAFAAIGLRRLKGES
jgi:ketosteroid isomerase-like protein